jgi:hypothetical protein
MEYDTMELDSVIILLKEKIISMMDVMNKKNKMSLFYADLYNSKLSMLEKAFQQKDDYLEKRNLMSKIIYQMKIIFPKFTYPVLQDEKLLEQQYIAYNELASILDCCTDIDFLSILCELLKIFLYTNIISND